MKTKRDNSEALNAAEVARILGVHVNTIKRIHSDELPFFRIGMRGDRRYRSADVSAYIAARTER
jgi:excisionase family DNA binding protein